MKQIYRIPLAILCISAAAIGLHFTSVLDNSETTISEENPGYDAQFQEMKQNENGVIPVRHWKKWNKESKSMNKAEFFSTVKELGPSNIGGRIRSLIIDQADPTRLIAGGVSGGIWISESSGSKWTPLDDDATILSITALAQSPFEHNIIYYTTGEQSYGANVNYNGNGVFKSTDGGNSFVHLSSTDIPAFYKTWDIEHSLTDSNTFYVATIRNGLYRSTDAGETFEQLFKSNTDIHDVDAMPDGTIYFTKEGSGVYKFKEQATPVIELIKGGGMPTSGFSRIALAPSLSNPAIVYCAMGGSGANRNNFFGLYKSTDTAKTWTELSHRSQTRLDNPWHNLMLDVHPTNHNIVLLGGVTAEYSTNGGTSWKALLNTHSDYHNLIFVPGSNDFYTVSDGGVYKYNTANANSTAVNGNGDFNITQFYAGDFFPTGEKVIAGAQDNWTTVNTLGDSRFYSWLGGDGSFNAVDATGDIIYASSQNGNIRRRNGGTWTNIYNSLRSKVSASDIWFINPFDLNPTDGTNIFFPTRNEIARSTNSGTSWTVITKKIPGNVFSVGITADANPTLYFGGAGSLLYRIDEANSAFPGESFKMFTLGPPLSRGGFIGNIEIDPNDKTTIYLAMMNSSNLPRIWKVTDANTESPQWVNISSNLPESLPVNWIEVDPKNSLHIMVATDYGLYVTTNGGKWWEKETRIPNVYVSMIKLRESDRKLFVFTYGRGVWVADLEENIFNSVSNSSELSLSVYPNPVSDLLTFSDVTVGDVSIVSLSGKLVYKGKTTNGRVETKDVPNGTYVVQVLDETGAVRNAKVLIQH
jgi:photosystem II stability/assembly factor-like uncharacterized protein